MPEPFQREVYDFARFLRLKSNGELQLLQEFESWEAASDEDSLKLEHSLARVNDHESDFFGTRNRDAKGKPVSVILPIKEYVELLERAEDVHDIAWLKKARRKKLQYRPLNDYLAKSS